MSTSILTIAIPTYNRHDRLLKTVDALIPQLNENCTILIIDNNSDVSIEKFLKHKHLLTSNKIRVMRNIVI